MIYTQLMAVLKKLEIEEIDCLGKPFDPLFHNAVKRSETEDYEENVICEVFQKGYIRRDKVIRYAMVAVAC